MNILLIHGFGGGLYEYKPITNFLNKKYPGINFFKFVYPKKFGQASISENSKKLFEYVSENLSGKNFSVVAISQGGIIFRHFVKSYPEFKNQISKVITLCTPFYGSFLAYLLPLVGVKDLRPNSLILKGLEEYDDGLSYYCVYNPLDTMVFPGIRAKFKKAKKNCKVLALLHPLTFYSPKTLKFIDEVLFSYE